MANQEKPIMSFQAYLDILTNPDFHKACQDPEFQRRVKEIEAKREAEKARKKAERKERLENYTAMAQEAVDNIRTMRTGSQPLRNLPVEEREFLFIVKAVQLAEQLGLCDEFSHAPPENSDVGKILISAGFRMDSDCEGYYVRLPEEA